MRILWICNVVLPEFSDEYHIKKVQTAGWISGMLKEMESEQEYVIGFAFPIFDDEKFHDGIKDNQPYYSFHAAMDEGDYATEYVSEFISIYERFKPDVIHIWGTEYRHSRIAVEAAFSIKMINHTFAHIQGLITLYEAQYSDGISDNYIRIKYNNYSSIYEDKVQFFNKSKDEVVTINTLGAIAGRTEWDELGVKLFNPHIHYYECDEILRKEIYNHVGEWTINNCTRHTIFISQASYPIKGFHFMIKALPYILDRYDDVQVFVSGANILENKDKYGRICPYGEYLQKLMSEHNVREYIHFLGLLDESEMIKQFLSSNVFVTPSTIENSSNSICEAMLIGTPTVSSYVGGTPSIVKDGEDGLLYPSGDYYMLAAKIINIFEDDYLAKRLSNNSINSGKKRNNRKRVKKQLIEIYKELGNPK